MRAPDHPTLPSLSFLRLPEGLFSAESGFLGAMADAWAKTSWTPFGDKTPVGWTITVAYFIAFGLTVWAYRRDRALEAHRVSGVRSVVWAWIGLGMLLLGLNKQLDLQRLVSRFARLLLLALHIHSMRRPMQVVFIGLVALIGLALLVFAVSRLRGLRAPYKAAVVGVAFLTVFVVSRAASFHHVDVVLSFRFHDVYVNTFLELGGIVWVAAAALAAVVARRPKGE